MVNVINPLTDPIGFIVFSFFFGIGGDTIGTIARLSIYSSVLAFPFVLLGRRVYSWVESQLKDVKSRLVVLFLATIVTVFLFIIIMRLWYVLWGSPFLSVGFSDFIIGFAVICIGAFILAVLGGYLSHLLHRKWDVPNGLADYVIDLIVCFALFIIAVVGLYVAGVVS
jgi:hypothetical protein